jgi:CarD family transcriptional regulator
MLEKGAVAVYGSHGLCRVSDIQVPSFIERGKEKLYYLLISAVDTNGLLYVPVEGAEDKMRDAIEADDAESLIEEIGDVDELEIPVGKKSEMAIVEVIKRNIAGEMMSLVKTLYKIKTVREMEGKKFAAMDEKYLAIAEKLLYSEIAYALDSDWKAIQERVRENLSQLTLETN